MNGSEVMAEDYARTLARYDWSRFSSIVPFVLPPFPFVKTVAARLAGTPVRVGVQNVHWSADGPFTGEVSATMAFEIGARLAEIGHAERRALFGETDEIIREKTRLAAATGLKPIICIGESQLERAAGAAAETVIRQAKIALSGLDHSAVEHCIFAYEPIWSIGREGTPAEPSAVATILRNLRTALVDTWGASGGSIPLLYGGSIGPDNATEFATISNVNGLFVGRAGWTAQGFLDLVERAGKSR